MSCPAKPFDESDVGTRVLSALDCSGVSYEIIAIEPEFADTAAF